ncbi:PAAR domain-containing protein [Sulfitobacter sp. D35]|uniref:PAAR domain-containing protein n=1 Tax=Sulfitobacter sp. D35 TaxID=3083252 RepID=UPI00296F588B|nr:PAAR domain-containing protein [Sulfitobacter sp. D35]MDW4498768.1 PAAR domain-containing protein [Sulfitobacter sp. D35]
MGNPAAKQGDMIVATDIHIVMIPSPGGPIPTPLPHPFTGQLDGQLSTDVMIEGKPAATQGSTATNSPAHIPQGGPFQSPPKNRGEIMLGSATVMVNGKPLARAGDTALTCNDPADLPSGTVIAVGTVLAGG